MALTSESNSVVLMVLNCLASVVLTTITRTNTHVHFHLLSILNIMDCGSMNMPGCFTIYLRTIFISINYGTHCVCMCECVNGVKLVLSFWFVSRPPRTPNYSLYIVEKLYYVLDI